MEIPKYFYFRVRAINKGTSIEVEDASDVDVVEVVRCKDCVHFWNGICNAHIDVIDMDENDFCSLGEREDEID